MEDAEVPAAVESSHSLAAILASRNFLIGVLCIAALLRLGHLFALRSTVYFYNLDLDPQSFDLWAQRIAKGDVIGDRMFFVDPLYPYFLGFLYTLFGRSLLVVRMVQAGLGIWTCWFTARLGQTLFRDVPQRGAAIGNGAALIVALYKPAIFYEQEIEKTVLAVFLTTSALYFLLRCSRRARFLGGVLWGFAVLSRANLLLLLPVLLFHVLFQRERRISWRLPKLDAASLSMVGAFVAGFLLILAPVVFRNHHVGSEWAITTSAGQNFYIGNNPLNVTGGYCFLPFVRATPHFEEADFHAAAEAEVGHALTPGQTSSFWMRKAFLHIVEEPMLALRLFARKALLLIADYELPDNQDMYFLARHSLVLRLPLFSFGLVFPLALTGMMLSFRRSEARLLIALSGIFGASILLFFVQARFRMPMVPVLAIFSSSALSLLVPRLRSTMKNAKWQAVLVSVGALLVTLLSFKPPANHDETTSFSLGFSNLGALYARLGRYDEAIAAYKKALQIAPGNIYALHDLGVLYLEVGHVREAREAFETCIRENPEHPDAWFYLGRVLEVQGKRGRAVAAYEKELQLHPNNAEAANSLAALRGLEKSGGQRDQPTPHTPTQKAP